MQPISIQQLLIQAAQLQAAGKFPQATELCRQVLSVSPNHPAALHLLGAMALQNKDVPRAIELLRQTVALQPENPGGHTTLGDALAAAKQFDQAVASYQRAIQLNPNYAKAHCNLGAAMASKQQYKQAILSFEQALRIKPDYLEALANLGNAQGSLKQYDRAAATYRRMLQFAPRNTKAMFNLAHAQYAVGELDEAIALYRKILAIKPIDAAAHSGLIFMMHYHPDFSAAMIQRELDLWNQQHAGALFDPNQTYADDRSPNRKLRIGYVSPEFCRHSIARFMLPLLESHDRENFEIVCYASVAHPDDVTSRLRKLADAWHDVNDLNDEALANRIREDRIDILVDLSLHTERNRLLTFARKPAPIQMTYLAYAGGSGMPAIDYRLSDASLDPNDATYAEKTLRLEEYWCYEPTGDEPPPSELPAKTNSYITFGCLNNFAKVSRPALRSWMELLKRVPNSRLLLHAPPGQKIATQVIAESGLDPSRITLIPELPSREYFARYQQIDIALDPFPFGGGTTSCDALWMGVPLVSFAGETAVSRAGLSLLTALGLPELAADSIEGYLNTATDLANDLPRLNELRTTLRQRMEKSRLMDQKRFARNLEQLYRTAWQKRCDQQS